MKTASSEARMQIPHLSPTLMALHQQPAAAAAAAPSSLWSRLHYRSLHQMVMFRLFPRILALTSNVLRWPYCCHLVSMGEWVRNGKPGACPIGATSVRLKVTVEQEVAKLVCWSARGAAFFDAKSGKILRSRLRLIGWICFGVLFLLFYLAFCREVITVFGCDSVPPWICCGIWITTGESAVNSFQCRGLRLKKCEFSAAAIYYTLFVRDFHCSALVRFLVRKCVYWSVCSGLNFLCSEHFFSTAEFPIDGKIISNLHRNWWAYFCGEGKRPIKLSLPR